MPNFTDVTEFILLWLTNHQELQVLFFVVFLVVYMITLIGNIGMIILIMSRAVRAGLISAPCVCGFCEPDLHSVDTWPALLRKL
ncbi:hypothetical protein FD754_014623 [Muntiacus muntjak]|uniref:G-protein coupled receptors family 1 profile domain-containing protein n=1 Tax=Muntiacus muntjak TaxID=9888 RepID=A0A5N3VP03_MUNMU|nr:hypothetical protein FD754_014623 [Muntiacus muntjak]